MTTPNTQTELDKAIEDANRALFKIARAGYVRMIDPVLQATVESESLQQLLLAAKRLKEVEKERDELANDIILLTNTWKPVFDGSGLHAMFSNAQEQLSALRAELDRLITVARNAEHDKEAAEAKSYEAQSIEQMFRDVKPTGDAEMYLRIWANCLDNKLYPKSHYIDALAKTTRLLQSDKLRLEEINKSLHELMVSGERRGVAKAAEENAALRAEIAMLRQANAAAVNQEQLNRNEANRLRAVLRQCAKERDFLLLEVREAARQSDDGKLPILNELIRREPGFKACIERENEK